MFSIELFERYQRSELCGHSFSASAISGMNRTLDGALAAFASRRLKEPYAYLILDARYDRVREGGVIASQAVLVAVAVDGEGRRQILGVDLANRESTELAGVSAATAAARPASRGVCGV